MTLFEMIAESGINPDNIAHICFTSAVEPPYCTVINRNPNVITADGEVVEIIEKLAVELYCEPSDETTHLALEQVFNNHKICYNVQCTYLGADEYLNMWIYTFDKKEDY